MLQTSTLKKNIKLLTGLLHAKKEYLKSAKKCKRIFPAVNVFSQLLFVVILMKLLFPASLFIFIKRVSWLRRIYFFWFYYRIKDTFSSFFCWPIDESKPRTLLKLTSRNCALVFHKFLQKFSWLLSAVIFFFLLNTKFLMFKWLFWPPQE